MIVNIITALLAGIFATINVYNLFKIIDIGRTIKKSSTTALLKSLPGSLYLRDRGPWESPEFELQVYRVEGILRIGYVADVAFPIPWEHDEMSNCLFISKDINNDEDFEKAIDEAADFILGHEYDLKPL